MKTDYREGIDVGSPAPATSWIQPDGSMTDLLNFRGSPVVLAFFNTDWDPGHAHQLKIFNEALAVLPERIQLLGFDGNLDRIRCEVAGDHPVEIPVVQGLDPNGDLAGAFGVRGRSAIFVIDAEGIVLHRRLGPPGSFPSSEELVRILNAIPRTNLSRRQFVFTAVATFAAIMLLPACRPDTPLKSKVTGGKAATFTLHINGQTQQIPADPRITVLDALRERLGMTGTKKGCDHGQCGACTVHMNGRRVNSCLLLAAQAEGAQITTIEGLAHGDRLHPVQEAFIEHDGFQCGYCTPGQIMSAVACIKEGHTRSKEEIREWMSGNICRCGAYQGILAAIEEAKTKI